MAAVLLFLLVVFVIVGWWLSGQRLGSKPWLETGLESVGEGHDKLPLPIAKIGLGVFLAVVGALFALLASGFFMRMEYPDWRSMPLPSYVWINTALLVLGSISMQGALISARKNESRNSKIWLGNACVATLGFLFGQALAWQHLSNIGYGLTANPANSFFYMITAIHGLHILGGVIALGRAVLKARNGASREDVELSLELCAIYWHFLLFVWFILLIVLVGWANDLFDLCTQLLN